MKPRKARRTGATETIGISLDARTKAALKRLAAKAHGGNVSALVSDMTALALRQAAFEKAWAWYGGPDPSDARRAEIDAEWEEGWTLARRHAAKRARGKSAA